MARGINGETGKIVDMQVYGLYESASVKVRFSVLYMLDLHAQRLVDVVAGATEHGHRGRARVASGGRRCEGNTGNTQEP